MDVAEPVAVAGADRRITLSAFPDGRLETATHASVFTDHFAGRPFADPDRGVPDFDFHQRSNKDLEPRREP